MLAVIVITLSYLQWVTSSTTTFLLKWYAPFLSHSGFGYEATSFLLALEKTKGNLDFQLQAVQFAEQAAFGPSLPIRQLLRTNRKATNTIVVCHSTPDAWLPASKNFPGWDLVAPCPPRDAHIRIGRVMYETDSVPKSWLYKINQMDYVWVPSTFAFNAFRKAGVAEAKLRIVPEPVDTDFFTPERCPEKNQQQPSSELACEEPMFTFLSIFKWEERKGWKILLQSFLEEFPNDHEAVRLVIKTSRFHAETTPEEMAQELFPQLTKRRKNFVSFVLERVSNEVLRDNFLCEANALVAPSYGEGWGRPQAEAASMALPVLYTDFSGTTQFLNASHALPIRVERMIPAAGVEEGHMWALPSVADLRLQMRHVFEQKPSINQEIGQRAREVMVKDYCLECVGKLTWNILLHDIYLYNNSFFF